MSDPSNPKLPRRGFFRSALRRTVAPLADWLDRSEPDRPQRPLVPLRPPGAAPEVDFSDTCQRCGACVEVCPANAIAPTPGDGPDAGTPYVDPDKSPCVVCEGLQCTHVCPSGALTPLFSASTINMGRAEVYESLCVRSQDEPCTLCVDRCPVGTDAIRFVDDGPPKVYSDGCVGCGVCQFYCPTTPKAIVVRPVGSAS